MRRTEVDSREVERILRRAREGSGVAGRSEAVSRHLLGRPYAVSPLVGSDRVPERFMAPLDSFDCVTYVESVYAAAFARDAADFGRVLRRLRYEGGAVEFGRRNHYMTGWIRNAARAGLFREVVLPGAVVKRRTLDVVACVPPRRASFRCLPKKGVRGAAETLRTGDLLCFASTRAHLDVFHCGLLVKEGERLLLRHAARSQGGVVEQELLDFLKANRMAGILVARAVELPA